MKVNAMIHSLGDTAEVDIIEKTGDNQYVADYNGVKCSAIYNPFVGLYYVDDKFGVIDEKCSKQGIKEEMVNTELIIPMASDLAKDLKMGRFFPFSQDGIDELQRKFEAVPSISKISPTLLKGRRLDIPAFEIEAKDKDFVGVPVSTCQLQMYDAKTGKTIAYGVMAKEFAEEVLKETKEPYYQFVGGKLDGMLFTSREDVEKIPEFAHRYMSDLSKEREMGRLVHSELLDNQPKFTDYVGPMLDGYRNGHPIIRYETQEVYDKLSENCATDGLKEDVYFDFFALIKNMDWRDYYDTETEGIEDIKNLIDYSPKTALDMLKEVEPESDYYNKAQALIKFIQDKLDVRHNLSSDTDIKKWYTLEYPSDECGNDLKSGVTFLDVWEGMKKGQEFYGMVFSQNKGDSIVRERIFGEMAEILDLDYEDVYQVWLKSDD